MSKIYLHKAVIPLKDCDYTCYLFKNIYKCLRGNMIMSHLL